MLPVQTIAAFVTASILLALAPGPDIIFVFSQSTLHGRSSGLFVMLGLCTGLVFHTAAVSLGVAVIFQKSLLAFTVLKYAGAAYLIYLAVQTFRASGRLTVDDSGSEINRFKLYIRGIIMNITNPKVSIFFLAFLPQFADPSLGTVPVQILILGLLFIFSTLLVFSSVALLAGTLGQHLNKSDTAQRIINRIAGFVFLALAIKFAVTKQ